MVGDWQATVVIPTPPLPTTSRERPINIIGGGEQLRAAWKSGEAPAFNAVALPFRRRGRQGSGPTCARHATRYPLAMTDRATKLVSAALRHVRDADDLLRSSPDQSWHLAGFGPECARKACLDQGWLDRVLGHDLAEVSDSVLEVALALDVEGGRYEVRDLASRYPELQRWSVESRYDRTGDRSAAEACLLVEQAAALTYALVADLWMDGRIEEVE